MAGIWLILGGILSVVWGVLLIMQPVIGVLVLTWWFGAYALAFGILLVVLAFQLRSKLNAECPLRAPAQASRRWTHVASDLVLASAGAASSAASACTTSGTRFFGFITDDVVQLAAVNPQAIGFEGWSSSFSRSMGFIDRTEGRDRAVHKGLAALCPMRSDIAILCRSPEGPGPLERSIHYESVMCKPLQGWPRRGQAAKASRRSEDRAIAAVATRGRKVRAPRNAVPGNTRRGRPQGQCHREQTADRRFDVEARVKGCGKSAPRDG